MDGLVYSLKQKKENSDDFYSNLQNVTDLTLESFNSQRQGLVNDYINFQLKEGLNIRTGADYFVEMILIGFFWNIYAARAIGSSFFWIKVASLLYRFRKPFNKPFIDKLRGFIWGHFLNRTVNQMPELSLANFRKLSRWMISVGEYEAEGKRFSGWINFLSQKSGEQIGQILQDFSHLARELKILWKSLLGIYTSNIALFVKEKEKFYRYREDGSLCLRREEEYHMNMVCSDILNRQLKVNFYKTTKKIVLLPTCMRMGYKCSSFIWDQEIHCAECNDLCRIGRLSRKLKSFGVEVRLMPHSSDFTKYLKKWKNSTTTGLVGIACVLNLLQGGLELLDLNIPSQCVYLDLCGCKSHWTKTPVSTDLNENRLMSVIRGEKNTI